MPRLRRAETSGLILSERFQGVDLRFNFAFKREAPGLRLGEDLPPVGDNVKLSSLPGPDVNVFVELRLQ